MEKPHGKSLRLGRHSQIGQAYLITSVTWERQEFFRDVWIGRILVAEMRRATDAGLVDSLAWVIMPDHLHWLFVLQDAKVETVMRQVKSCSAIAINRQIGTSQKIWQSGYHDHALRHEEDMRKIARYIIANPLRAGLVKHIGDYPLWDAIWL
jgi:REP element-mobilizing transposase RayT